MAQQKELMSSQRVRFVKIRISTNYHNLYPAKLVLPKDSVSAFCNHIDFSLGKSAIL